MRKAIRERYELFTSDVTIAELEKASKEVRENSLKIIETFKVKIMSRTAEAKELADEYQA